MPDWLSRPQPATAQPVAPERQLGHRILVARRRCGWHRFPPPSGGCGRSWHRRRQRKRAIQPDDAAYLNALHKLRFASATPNGRTLMRAGAFRRSDGRLACSISSPLHDFPECPPCVSVLILTHLAPWRVIHEISISMRMPVSHLTATTFLVFLVSLLAWVALRTGSHATADGFTTAWALPRKPMPSSCLGLPLPA